MAEETVNPTSARVVVADGLEILLRPVRPDDKRRLSSAFERLSPETRYRRFFAPLEKLSDQDLRHLTEVDHHDHEAIVAVNPENGAIVAVARYVRSEDPTEAEVAVVVGDPWQGHGVATALLQQLVSRARDEGIDHFVALVMSENTELVLALPDPERIGESTLGGALRAAAGGLRINPWSVLRDRIGR